MVLHSRSPAHCHWPHVMAPHLALRSLTPSVRALPNLRDGCGGCGGYLAVIGAVAFDYGPEVARKSADSASGRPVRGSAALGVDMTGSTDMAPGESPPASPVAEGASPDYLADVLIHGEAVDE